MAELRATSVDLNLPPVARWAVVGALLVVDPTDNPAESKSWVLGLRALLKL